MTTNGQAVDWACQRFLQHSITCPTCNKAGGEWARTRDLCSTGRQLRDIWTRAEEAHALAQKGLASEHQ